MFYEAAINSPRLLTSPWVMYALALVFTAGGARLIEMSLGNPSRGDWFGFIFCAGTGAAFVSIPWDGHPEACHTSTSFAASINSMGLLSGTNFCQRAFGAMGFCLLLLAVLFAKRWIASRFGKKPSFY